ncbi:hypothetical protein [uncultured Providencia sp.]|uniref:hypothetical protein n=1 Tax=uncultured Providencia sp. TaxID=390517 RepID=UPI00300FA04C
MEMLSKSVKKITALNKESIFKKLSSVYTARVFIGYNATMNSSAQHEIANRLKNNLSDNILTLAIIMESNIDNYINKCKLSLDKLNRNTSEDILVLYFHLVSIHLEYYINSNGIEQTISKGEIIMSWPDYYLSFRNDEILNNLADENVRKIYEYVRDGITIDIFKRSMSDSRERYDELYKINEEADASFKARAKIAVEDLEEKINEFQSKSKEVLQEKFSQLEKIEERINSNSDKAIFISLDQGYRNLYNTKRIEKWFAFIWVLILGLLVFSPALIKLFGIMGYIKLPVYNIYGYIGSATITFILLYYFRISYINYNSIKTEITQIALRRNLCAFINGYVDFSERNKKAPEAFKQFENIIFSNIVSDTKNIPTTYDGIEQLAKLINSLKTPPRS